MKGATFRFTSDVEVPSDISIHAPVKGATEGMVASDDLPLDFNPRTREGCDCISPNRFLLFRYFNPRTREGCDPTKSPRLVPVVAISIHAPVKGATSDFY